MDRNGARPNRTRLARATTAAVVVLLLQPAALGPVRADDGLAPLLTGWMQNFTPTAPGKPMPDAVFARDDGSAVTLADYAGRMVVLNFFATWCVPCRREMPSLDRLQATLGDRGVVVVTVSEDRAGFEVIAPFFAASAISTRCCSTSRCGACVPCTSSGCRPPSSMGPTASNGGAWQDRRSGTAPKPWRCSSISWRHRTPSIAPELLPSVSASVPHQRVGAGWSPE